MAAAPKAAAAAIEAEQVVDSIEGSLLRPDVDDPKRFDSLSACACLTVQRHCLKTAAMLQRSTAVCMHRFHVDGCLASCSWFSLQTAGAGACSMRGQFEAMIRKGQDEICAAVEAVDGGKFREDAWVRPGGGGGISRVLQVTAQL
jgi:hypothetical protein